MGRYQTGGILRELGHARLVWIDYEAIWYLQWRMGRSMGPWVHPSIHPSTHSSTNRGESAMTLQQHFKRYTARTLDYMLRPRANLTPPEFYLSFPSVAYSTRPHEGKGGNKRHKTLLPISSYLIRSRSELGK